MIYVYTGKNGSGKTWSMARHAYRAWRRGHDVYTNTPLFFCHLDISSAISISDNRKYFSVIEQIIYFIFRYPFKRGRIVFFRRLDEIIHARNGLILFDEGQALFNARSWDSLPEEFQYMLQQHRKYSLDLYTTTPNYNSIDPVYRRLVHKWYYHKRILPLGFMSLHFRYTKDEEEITTTADELQVTNKFTWPFIVSIFHKKIYDTMYDIGFKRFQIIWINNQSKSKQDSKIQSKDSSQRVLMIIPQNTTLKDALRAISSHQSISKLNK